MNAYQEEPQWDLEPDKHRLDVEWCQQPKLYHYYADLLATARNDQKVCEAKLEIVEAETKMAIRNDPEKYGANKVTEDVVKSLLVMQAPVKEARKRLIDAECRVDQVNATVRALDHRKSALENLVSLGARDYFAEPKAKPPDREVVEEMKRKELYRSNRISTKGKDHENT